MKGLNFILILSFAIIGCSKSYNQYDRVPDHWFTIKPTLIGFNEYDLCYELKVEQNYDSYSIRRENECFVPPVILVEKDRGDIIISYEGSFNTKETILLRKFDKEYYALYMKIDNGGLDIINDKYWYSTVDSLESLKLIQGIKYGKIEIEELIIDFRKDFLTREFFDSIKVK